MPPVLSLVVQPAKCMVCEIENVSPFHQKTSCFLLYCPFLLLAYEHAHSPLISAYICHIASPQHFKDKISPHVHPLSFNPDLQPARIRLADSNSYDLAAQSRKMQPTA